MSVKRQATTELNRDNWDQEDEPEDMGTFKTASKDELEKRVIRTAKRRSLASSNDPKKSVFSGFGGFQKTQPSSFDFLANLTNGNKNATATSSDKNDTSNAEGALDSKPSSTVPSGIFGVTATSTPTKSTFGLQSSQTSLFCVSSTNATSSPSIFTMSKSNPLQTDSPFKINTSSSDNARELAFKNIHSNSMSPKMSPTVFNVATESSNKALNNSNVNSTVFKIHDSSSNAQNTSSTKSIDTKNESGNNEKKLEYHAKLKGLNESVSKWIKKHVDETPVCILTPIFNDYEKYLKEIQDEYQDVDKSDEKGHQNDSSSNVTANKQGLSLFSNANSKPTTIFGNTSLPSVTPTSTPGFKFGVFTTNASTAVTSAPFSFTSNTTTTTNGTTFTFGSNKPITFTSNTEKSAGQQNDTNEEDEPPKVEFTPVVEENSVYDKKCKIFVKKDGNFVDKGVGTLYIKRIEETGKHQLLVRANTNLGTVLLNLILSTTIPTQRMGKNNVMLVCIPTPDSKPPPVPVLIRVKSSEEADELLETLDKYKT